VRIAHVTDFYEPRLGGIETQVADLAVRQAAAGHEVEIITTTPELGLEMSGADGVLVHRVAAGLRAARFRPVGIRRGRHAVRTGRYDVVHAHLGLISPLAQDSVRTAARAGVPVVATLHSLTDYLSPLLGPLDLLTGWARWPVVWTAVSRTAGQPLTRFAGPVQVLPNGIEARNWRLPAAPRTDDEVVLVSVMRLVSRKRALPLVRTLRAIGARTPPGQRLRAVIVGDGPQRPRVERYLARHRLDEWVTLTGRLERDEIRELLAGADVFLAPARLESFGIAALEARCAGVPVVARRESGVAEFIRHGREGLLVSSDHEMTAAVLDLVRRPDARSDIAAHNRAVLPPYDWSQLLGAIDELYVEARTLVLGPREHEERAHPVPEVLAR
jgi:glycosyltransferase involved in cell wall biosynthesis